LKGVRNGESRRRRPGKRNWNPLKKEVVIPQRKDTAAIFLYSLEKFSSGRRGDFADEGRRGEEKEETPNGRKGYSTFSLRRLSLENRSKSPQHEKGEN